MPMYNVSPQVAQAWEELLQCLTLCLRDLGWQDPLEIARAPPDLLAFWQSPDVLLTQTCGYPFVTQLMGKVRLVATPRFDLPGCDGVSYRSYFVVKEQSPFETLEALRGGRAVINQPHSQSGMNALRNAIAPLALEGRFFGSVVESGSHLASLDFVQRGHADVASIDCVTFGLAARYAPKWVEGIRILSHSEPTPGLPLIASSSASEEQVKELINALNSLKTTAPELLRILCLSGFERLDQADYGVISNQVANAISRGYPNLR